MGMRVKVHVILPDRREKYPEKVLISKGTYKVLLEVVMKIKHIFIYFLMPKILGTDK